MNRTIKASLLIALLAALIACSSPPQPASQNGTWDQSNFETARWN